MLPPKRSCACSVDVKINHSFMMVVFMICLLVPSLSMMLVLMQVMMTLVALITLVPVTMAGTLGMARGKVASSKDAEAVCSGAANIYFHDAASG
jgi:ABC-type dipeptide/oligopeptide/nickel transport system permease subunit